MSHTTHLFAGILLITLVTVELGGNFLLKILRGTEKIAPGSPTHAYFRAGHAHAGVMVILALVGIMYVDAITLPDAVKMAVRCGLFAAPLLVAGGFFGGGAKVVDNKPAALIVLVSVGGLVLAASLATLGVGLLLVANG